MRNGSFRAAFCFDCIGFWLQKPVLTQVLLRKKHLHSSIQIRLLVSSRGLFLPGCRVEAAVLGKQQGSSTGSGARKPGSITY